MLFDQWQIFVHKLGVPPAKHPRTMKCCAAMLHFVGDVHGKVGGARAIFGDANGPVDILWLPPRADPTQRICGRNQLDVPGEQWRVRQCVWSAVHAIRIMKPSISLPVHGTFIRDMQADIFKCRSKGLGSRDGERFAIISRHKHDKKSRERSRRARKKSRGSAMGGGGPSLSL